MPIVAFRDKKRCFVMSCANGRHFGAACTKGRQPVCFTINMGLINKVDMVCLSPVGYGV